jgi:hypothetical protein
MLGSTTHGLSGFSFFFPDEGCAWNTNRGRVAFTFYSQERTYDRVLYRRDLTGPADALTNLTVSVRALDIPAVVGTNRNTGSSVTYDVFSAVAADAYLAEAHGSATNGASSSTFGWTYAFDYDWHQDYDSDGGDSYRSTHTFFKRVEGPTAYAAGAAMEYPSTWAVTNGYVARMQIYGVFTYSIDTAEPTIEASSFDPYVVFDATYAGTLAEFGGVSFSHTLSAPELSGFPRVASTNAIGMPLGFTSPSHTTVLVLLYDKADPASVSDLLWTNAVMPTMTISSYPSANWLTGIDHYVREDLTEFSSLDADYGGTITVTPHRLISVVTWNWKHKLTE